MESRKRLLNSYLFLTSGIQMLLSVSYCFVISQGKDEQWKEIYGSKYPIYKYSTQSFFVNALLYHCLSKPFYKGVCGFRYIDYVFLLMNANQVFSILFFLIANFTAGTVTFYVVFQILEYTITCIFASILNYDCFRATWRIHQNVQKNDNNSISMNLYIRRRDWGIASTLLSAAQVILLYPNFVRYAFLDRDTGVKKYGDYLALYVIGLLFLVSGALGIHVLSFKVSKGFCGCHQRLNRIYLSFITIEIIGMMIYIYSSLCAQRTFIFYYHAFVFGMGTIISSLGNSMISKLKLSDDIAQYNIPENDNDTSRLTIEPMPII